jgi:hypothetical protein
MVEVLRRQKELGQTNQECALSAGMSVETIKRWRARLRVRAGLQGVPLIEWSPVAEVASVVQLQIELPGGIRFTVPGPWSASRLAELVSALRSS